MTEPDSSELGNILNQENLIIEQVTSILRVAQRQEVMLVWLFFSFILKNVYSILKIATLLDNRSKTSNA